jgi:PAS domain S-box-containing protein
MTPNVEPLQALRDCCRDEVAFQKLKEILATMSVSINLEAERVPKAHQQTRSPLEESSTEEQLCEVVTCEQIEQALRESEAKYRELVENANSIIVRLDTQGNITFFNEFAQTFFGYSHSEILGRPALGTIIPETETCGRNLVNLTQDLIEHPENYCCHENENVCRNGDRVWVAWTNKAILDATGQVTGILCIGNDITERYWAQEALRASEARYRVLSEELEQRVQERTTELTQANEQLKKEIAERTSVEKALERERNFVSTVLDMAGALLVVLDRQGNIIRFNRACEQATGYSFEEVRNSKIWDLLLLPTEVESVKQLVEHLIDNAGVYCQQSWQQNALTGNFPNRYENHWIARDGSCRLISWSNTVLPDRNGAVNYIIGVGIDVTDHRRAEVALRESEVRYKSLYNKTPVMLHSIDAQGRLISVSDYWLECMGYDRSEVIGRPSVEFLTPQSQRYAQDVVLPAYFETGICKEVPYQFVKKNGEIIDVLLSAIAEKDEEGQVYRSLAVLVDITDRKCAQAALAKSEAWFKTLIQGSTDMIDVLDREGNYLYVSPSSQINLGVEPEALLGTSCWDGIHPDDLAVAKAAFEEILQNPGKPVQVTVRVLYPDHGWMYLEVLGRNLIDDPAIGGIVLNSRNITERQQAKEREERLIASLQTANDQLQAILDAVPGCIFWIGSDLKYLGINRYLANTFHLSPEEIVGQELGYSASTPELKEFVTQFFTEQSFVASQEITLKVDGSSRRYLLFAQKYLQGEAAVCVGFDITELKRTEEALRSSEEKFAKAFRCCPSAISISTLADGRYIEVNQAFLRSSGYQREEVIGRTASELGIWVNSGDRDRLIQMLQQQGAIYNHEIEFRSKSGDIVVGLVSAEMISFEGKSCILALTNDITQRKQAEKRIKQSEEQYRAIFEAATDGLIINDLSGQIVEANPAVCQMHGYSYEEFISLDPKTLVHPVSYPALQEYLKAIRQGNSFSSEAYDLRKDGIPFPVEVRSTTFTYKGQPHYLAILRDITERKRAEEQLLEAAQRERLLGEIASRIRQSLDLNEILNTTVQEIRQFLQADRVNLCCTDTNPYGKIVAEAVAPNWPSCLDVALKDDNCFQELVPMFADQDVKLIEDATLAEEPPALQKRLDLYQITAAMAVCIVVDEQPCGMLVVSECSGPRCWQSWEVDLLRSLATQVAIAIKQGRLYQQLLELNASLEQQVQQRTAQLMAQNQELQELNQLKDVFLQAVSHDLRNPVTGTLMVLRNLLNTQASVADEREQTTIPVSRSVLSRMIQSNERQLGLINSLLEVHMVREQGVLVKRSPVQLAQLLKSLVAEMEPILAKNQATLTLQVCDDLPPASADASQLWRVFENLITNALKYNPPGVNLTISTTIDIDQTLGNHTSKTLKSLDSPNNAKAKMIRCAVADDGVGITQEQCDRLFELYYRGSSTRRSTGFGLGLYLCQQIVKAHGGEIGVISSPGAGATFWFTLPLA